MTELGYEPFSLEEVRRAHDDAVRAQTGNATWKYSPTQWTKYIGNPDDGGAMSQGHIHKLLQNRFGDGNYEFRRVDKSTLVSDTSVDEHYIATGVLERARVCKPGQVSAHSCLTCLVLAASAAGCLKPGQVEFVYGTKAEIKDTLTQNKKFYHTIYINPGRKYFICKNKRDDIGVYTQLPIDWLHLGQDGNPKRGGYMRHINRVFRVGSHRGQGTAATAASHCITQSYVEALVDALDKHSAADLEELPKLVLEEE